MPDFLARGFRPTACFAARPTARPAFFPASDRFPAGLYLPVARLPTAFLVASAAARAAFVPASDSKPPGLLIFDLAMIQTPERRART